MFGAFHYSIRKQPWFCGVGTGTPVGFKSYSYLFESLIPLGRASGSKIAPELLRSPTCHSELSCNEAFVLSYSTLLLFWVLLLVTSYILLAVLFTSITFSGCVYSAHITFWIEIMRMVNWLSVVWSEMWCGLNAMSIDRFVQLFVFFLN